MDVEWSDRALDDMGKLDSRTRQRIFDTVVRYVDSGHGDVRQIKGSSGHRRLRVGQYRVRFVYDESSGERVLVVLHVLHRSRAYRDLDD